MVAAAIGGSDTTCARQKILLMLYNYHNIWKKVRTYIYAYVTDIIMCSMYVWVNYVVVYRYVITELHTYLENPECQNNLE